MISSENYYEIKAYSDLHWQSLDRYKTSREIITSSGFLSAKHSCLVGEKGVGKTVLVSQIASQRFPGAVLYCSLDDTLFAPFTMFEIAKMASDQGTKLIIFDEVHRYPDWKYDLKSIVDRLEIPTIISGSSILSFDQLGGLARRLVKYELMGLSFREYLHLAYGFQSESISLSQLTAEKNQLVPKLRKEMEAKIGKPIGALFQEYLRKGYYPYSLVEPNLENFLKMLRQSTEDTLSYEIVIAQTHSRPDMARKLQSLFSAIARNVPYTVDYKDLKAYAGISDLRTLKNYLACLGRAGIVKFVDKLNLKGHRKPDKIYLGNTNLYFAYAQLNPNLGSLRETFFLNCLKLAGLNFLSHKGSADFQVDELTFEIGGPGKSKSQIRNAKKAFLVVDDTSGTQDPQILPLWIFGFLKSAGF